LARTSRFTLRSSEHYLSTVSRPQGWSGHAPKESAKWTEKSDPSKLVNWGSNRSSFKPELLAAPETHGTGRVEGFPAPLQAVGVVDLLPGEVGVVAHAICAVAVACLRGTANRRLLPRRQVEDDYGAQNPSFTTATQPLQDPILVYDPTNPSPNGILKVAIAARDTE
jgi:hypothetical protein